MKTKKIPAIVMLIGGAATCVITYLNHYNLRDMLIALVWALIAFLVLGIVIELLFEKFEIAKDEDEEVIFDGDGEVVEKTEEESDAFEGEEGNADEWGDFSEQGMNEFNGENNNEGL